MSTPLTLDPVALAHVLAGNEDAVHTLAAALVPVLETRSPPASPYMSADEVAEFLRLPRGKARVYELFADGTLTREGTRNHALALRSEVEAYARRRT